MEEVIYNIAIVIPIYRAHLSKFEMISLKQAARKLSSYPFVFVTHKKISTDFLQDTISTFGVVSYKELFGENNFGSIEDYNKLLLDRRFYKRFRHYHYLLIHQLDAFVFRDCLNHWCHAAFAYVGAPWLAGFHAPLQGADYVGVGNGGLSLRKVDQFLRVLSRFSYIEKPISLLDCFSRDTKQFPLRSLMRLVKCLTFSNNTFALFNDYRYNEDDFWGRIVPRNFKWFQVPDAQEALDFSMEVNPRKMFEDNGKRLPFGCHAWWRYDLDFWKPFIESEGHIIENE